MNLDTANAKSGARRGTAAWRAREKCKGFEDEDGDRSAYACATARQGRIARFNLIALQTPSLATVASPVNTNIFRSHDLERLKKYCSRSAKGEERAVFLGFGFASAQLQGSFEPAPSPKPRQNPKILAPNGCGISLNALVLKIILALLFASARAVRCMHRRRTCGRRAGKPGRSKRRN